MHPVIVQEKIDGSQFSFGLIEGRLRMKSHHQDISDIVGEYGLFTEAIAYVRDLHSRGLLHPEWTYRGEVLQSKCHNKLEYNRVPLHNIVGFDVATGNETYLGYIDAALAFKKLDLEIVPYYHFGVINNPATINTFLDRQPLLGGKMIEGIVIKAHGFYGEDKKTLMAKYVNPKFREIMDTGENQKSVDFLQQMIDDHRTEARWDKAILHFKEQGKLLGEPKDIGPLIGEITRDLKEEAEEGIKARLWKRYWPHVARGVTGGFAEYYKRKLMEGAFAQDSVAEVPSDTPSEPIGVPADAGSSVGSEAPDGEGHRVGLAAEDRGTAPTAPRLEA